jgi:hypothetical protein
LHRKRSSGGRRSGIDWRSTGSVHWEAQEVFQQEWIQIVSKNKEKITWKSEGTEPWKTRRI